MDMTHNGLPILTFDRLKDLRAWMIMHHQSSNGVWVRVYKKSSSHVSISFEELLDEGLCFGWSESLRHKFDGESYLQKFAPRKKFGTQSERNERHIEQLIVAGRMTDAGLRAVGRTTNGT